MKLLTIPTEDAWCMARAILDSWLLDGGVPGSSFCRYCRQGQTWYHGLERHTEGCAVPVARDILTRAEPPYDKPTVEPGRMITRLRLLKVVVRGSLPKKWQSFGEFNRACEEEAKRHKIQPWHSP